MSEIDHTKMPRPDLRRSHVVILGAGASCAAFSNGERHGRKMPLLRDLIDVVGLAPILRNAGFTGNCENFEELYSNLVAGGSHPELVAKIQRQVFDYFAAM